MAWRSPFNVDLAYGIWAPSPSHEFGLPVLVYRVLVYTSTWVLALLCTRRLRPRPQTCLLCHTPGGQLPHLVLQKCYVEKRLQARAHVRPGGDGPRGGDGPGGAALAFGHATSGPGPGPGFFCVLTNPFWFQYAPVHFSRLNRHILDIGRPTFLSRAFSIVLWNVVPCPPSRAVSHK